jgi:hypothetical protein
MIQEFAKSVCELDNWNFSEKIQFFAWCLHEHAGQERFSQADIRQCFDEMHLPSPSSISPFFASLASSKRRVFLKDRQGYRLSKASRDEFQRRYGGRQNSVVIERLLAELPAKVATMDERIFLEECLACYRAGAFRASVVMAWNLAFDHLCNYILAEKITEFNNQLPLSYPKSKIKAIAGKVDFEELKEFEVIQVCKSARIFSSGVAKVLGEKLGKRNSAAHPSDVVVSAAQAEDVISDLVNNVITKLAY